MQFSLPRAAKDGASQFRESSDPKQEGSAQTSTSSFVEEVHPHSIDDMHASYVYKRRKLRNSVALLSEGNCMGSTVRSSDCNSSLNSEFISLENYNNCVQGIPALPVNTSVSVQSHRQKLVIVLASQTDDTKDPVLPSNHADEGQEHPTDKVWKLALGYNNVRGSSSSSKCDMEQGSTLMKIKAEDVGQRSFSSDLVVEPSGEHVSANDVLISVPVSYGQPGDCPPTSGCTSVAILGGNDATFCLSCKVCGIKDNPLKMLICDLCEEAFHLSCCMVKKLPNDEWFCRPCLRKKAKVLPEALSGKLLDVMSKKQRERMLQEKLGSILYMLEDKVPYTSRVRIGKDFQAEVPEWTGPIPDDDYYCGTPLELDHAECDGLNGKSLNRPSRPNSIGNWLQCREKIYNETGETAGGVICGKWRRAPLFVCQTEDWDCSCAVLWDPIHADCAVPQELETSEVLKQLKFIDLLKPRLSTKK
uniref:Remodeling and spacing factor 1 n=1 Tax=Anthurium amnicola TaxID=1678845 RepID=A0A1D1ZE19_9ARAE